MSIVDSNDEPNDIISDVIIDFNYCEETNLCTYIIEGSHIVFETDTKIINWQYKDTKKTFKRCWNDSITIDFKKKNNELHISCLRYTKKPFNYIINSNTHIILNKINITGFVNVKQCLSLTMDYIEAGSYIMLNSSGDISSLYVKSDNYVEIKATELNNINGTIESSEKININTLNINNNYGKIIGNSINITTKANIDNSNGHIESKLGIFIAAQNRLNNTLGIIKAANENIYIGISSIINGGLINEIGRIISNKDVTIEINYTLVKCKGYNYNNNLYSLNNNGGIIKSSGIVSISGAKIINIYSIIDGEKIFMKTFYIENIHGFIQSIKTIHIDIMEGKNNDELSENHDGEGNFICEDGIVIIHEDKIELNQLKCLKSNKLDLDILKNINNSLKNMNEPIEDLGLK